jgi:hypothetical protein
MTSDATKSSKCKKGRKMLYVSLFAFSLYMVNVLIGKANIVFGWKAWHLGNVAECLLLFLTSTLLIIAAMQRESALASGSQTPELKGGKV